MSYGKMNNFIELISTEPVIDPEGFAVSKDTVLKRVRAYKEERHGNERWANNAVFSEATALFRFRKIPDIKVTTKLIISCEDEKYNILSVEDVKGRGMYIEVMAKKIEPSN